MLAINTERLARRFSAMARIGATPKGGVHRLALSDGDKAARDLLLRWCDEAGLERTIDQMGNMFATWQGGNAALPPLLIGSHLDSQPYAGAYDGPVGVLAALEVVQVLAEQNIKTKMPVQLVNWTNEEGARFRPPLLGSAVFAGLTGCDSALALKDSTGCRLGAELARIGYAGTVKPGWPVSGYIEVHIEQGTVLEDAHAVIGVVSGVVGIHDFKVTVTGEDAHAGPLPMLKRKDAMLGAAHMIIAAREVGLAHGPDARVTVGRIALPSDSHSVVPGLCEFTLDLRHINEAGLVKLETECSQAFSTIAEAQNLGVALQPSFSYAPTPFDETLQHYIADAAQGLDLATLTLPSRAGHDAWNMARLGPAAMIFIPCRGGISHNEAEFAEMEHIHAASCVLLNTVLSYGRV